MVSIIILAIALIPMAGMFEMGINSATKGGQYDKARALANLKMEEAKSLTFTTVRDNFPQAGNGTPYTAVNWINGPGRLRRLPVQGRETVHDRARPGGSGRSLSFCHQWYATGLIRVNVIVQWGDGNTYTTYGLVGQGQ